MLRKWQIECSARAFEKYQKGNSHFFCQATPGAGKTVLAATVALKLLNHEMIDLVLCFSPSVTVAEGIKNTFSKILERSFSGGLGSIGKSLTYQSIQFLDEDFWQTLKKHRVFVVFDEIHHCSGSDVENANVWGQQILKKIQGLATYTLAMSGTPWRSDSLPIVMAEYTDPDGCLLVDYQYTLKQAVVDKVCRVPKLVLVDSDNLSVRNNDKIESFSSILEMMKETKTSYQSVIHNQDAMEHLLGLGCKKLFEVRKSSPFAGGLVVAASVQHAQVIKNILSQKYSQTVSIVTYRHEDPLSEIKRFRQGDTQWIVSVGMISEGTDIPRLQVCCHMSSVKTELYFRQVLGRILRVNEARNQQAWLFTFAEQNLVEFAERIEQDIPESCMFARLNLELQHSQPDTKPMRNYSVKSTAVTPPHTTLRMRLNGMPSQSADTKKYGVLEPVDCLQIKGFRERIISAFLAN
ncbi:DEAD/DEAH box helicase family protein [Vibrio sp. 99-70-13A1]|uniref:DEAD/DEAH box helicase n=1 Tax=Vibrio sp. 99-70-13A1 TaxID=2607601 RepID=UPI00149380BE|nr:DEAD/DEAH box helicase family protein [Vibrio sp. 99-70-13A1]NOH97823.1 AAA family ATPase [Vibrio sp. 99-70-13A1]